MNGIAHVVPSALDKPEKPKTAIELLPEEFQPCVRFFFGFWSDTLRGTSGIATRIRWWIQEDGLTVADMKLAMKRLMSPERSAEIENSPKSLAALSGEIATILKERRSKEEQERRRSDAEEAIKGAASAASIREMLAERMKA